MGGEGDEDRTAILERRRRLIALALSGLAGAAGCDEPAPAPPRAAVEAPAEERPMQPVDTDHEPDSTPEEPLASADPIDDGLPDPAEVRHAEERKRRWRRGRRPVPIPCLSIARPPPAPRPQVCLSLVPFEKPGGASDDEPA